MNFETNESRQERLQQKTTLVVVIIGLIWILTRVAVAGELPSWTKDHHRTQGGGWIWFPGNALAITEIEADMMAKGKAIAYLMEECQLPHKEIRFNERYIVEEDGKFRVFVRASITQRQCKEGKYGSMALRSRIVNRHLLGLYRQYMIKIAEIQVADKICRADTVYCLDLAKQEVDMNNWYKAYTYAEKSCKHGLKEGCNAVRIISRYLITNDK